MNRNILFSICLLFFLFLMILAGCATKATVKPGTSLVTPEKPGTGEPGAEQPVPEKQPEDPYRQIEELVTAGEIGKALQVFENSIKEKATSEDLSLFGLLLVSDGKFEEAKAAFLESLALDPGNTEALYNLALYEGLSGDTKKQEEYLRSILAGDPENADAQAALGEILLDRKKTADAKQVFTDALALDQGSISARMGYGSVLMAEKNFMEAAKEFSAIIAGSPDFMFAYIDRSRAYQGLEKFGEAETDLTAAIAIDPGYAWNYLDRGRLRVNRGKLYDALGDFDKAIELDEDNFFPYAYKAGILDDLGRVDEAVAAYRKVLELRGDYYFIYAPLGTLLYMRNQWDEAGSFFAKAYEFDKQSFEFVLLAGLCYKRGGNNTKSGEYLTKLLPTIPRESLYYHVARFLLEPGYDNQAIYYISKEKDENMKTRMLFYLAASYVQQNRISLAQTYLLEVKDKSFPGMIEGRLAEWELAELQSPSISGN